MHKQIALFLLTTSFTAIASIGNLAARAATPDTAPPGLVNAITALDNAANKRDLDAVMQFYQPEFKQTDGLTKDKLRQSLESLWQGFKQLQYRTELVSWENNGDLYTVKTITQIKGARGEGDSSFMLDAKLTSSQVYKSEGGKWQISRQDILSEKSSLTSGDEPPNVELRLPQKIGVGRQYALDAIVTKPLGNSLLLGAAIEESVTPNDYFKSTTIDLEPLKSGGIFKIGQAPYKTGDRWISVVLVQESGITISSQRLRVSSDTIGKQYTPLPEALSTPSRVRPDPKIQPSS